jgi:hypothetical protein
MRITMAFAKLILTPAWKSYTCTEASNIEMGILGSLLSRDVECDTLSYKQTLADNSLRAQCGNFTLMAKENGYVLISDLYSEEVDPIEFKISQQAFIQLLDDWQEKVCKHTPREVLIKEEGGKFTIETKD